MDSFSSAVVDERRFDERAKQEIPALVHTLSATRDAKFGSNNNNNGKGGPVSSTTLGGLCTSAFLDALLHAASSSESTTTTSTSNLSSSGGNRKQTWASVLQHMDRQLREALERNGRGMNMSVPMQLPLLTTSQYVHVDRDELSSLFPPPPPPVSQDDEHSTSHQSSLSLMSQDSSSQQTPTPTRRALLIGINYASLQGKPSSPPALHGCHRDVKQMEAYLKRKANFSEQDLIVLMDDEKRKRIPPTKQNILNAFGLMVKLSKPGDSIFLHYAGECANTVVMIVIVMETIIHYQSDCHCHRSCRLFCLTDSCT